MQDCRICLCRAVHETLGYSCRGIRVHDTQVRYVGDKNLAAESYACPLTAFLIYRNHILFRVQRNSRLRRTSGSSAGMTGKCTKKPQKIWRASWKAWCQSRRPRAPRPCWSSRNAMRECKGAGCWTRLIWCKWAWNRPYQGGLRVIVFSLRKNDHIELRKNLPFDNV